MRAAASGMSREDGFAAMKAEADELKAGKAPKEVGFIDRDGKAFRARVQFKEEGILRHIPGPWRPDEEAAKSDLASMRAAASGMGREDGLAAMAAEAKRLREGKPMTEGGCVKEIERSYRAVFSWQDERDVKGPRRAEKRRAEEDLEALREASSNQADPAARRAALVAEVHRLQHLAEREVHVSIAARGLAQQQPVSTAPRPQQLSNVLQHPVGDDSDDSQSDWEIGEPDDADVVYAWEKFDDQGRPLPEEQQHVAPSVPQPEPKNPDEGYGDVGEIPPHSQHSRRLTELTGSTSGSEYDCRRGEHQPHGEHHDLRERDSRTDDIS